MLAEFCKKISTTLLIKNMIHTFRQELVCLAVEYNMPTLDDIFIESQFAPENFYHNRTIPEQHLQMPQIAYAQ